LLTGAGYLLLLPQQWVRSAEPARFILDLCYPAESGPGNPAAAQEVSIFMGPSSHRIAVLIGFSDSGVSSRVSCRPVHSRNAASLRPLN